jgi:hypothetical protein
LQIRSPHLPLWGNSSARSRARASRRRVGSSRSSPPSRRPRLPSSASARPGRKRRANSSGSTPCWRRRGLPSSSGTRRSRGPPGSWSRRVCPTRACSRPVRKRMSSSSSYNRRPPLRAPPSSRRRRRSRVSYSSYFSLACSSLGSAPNLVRTFAFRPTNDSWDVGDTGVGDPDGLQFLPAGAGRAAGRGPRGVPGHQGRKSAGREFHGKSPQCLGRACYPAYASRTSPGGP